MNQVCMLCVYMWVCLSVQWCLLAIFLLVFDGVFLCLQIVPQEMAENCFWLKVKEERFENPDMFSQLSLSFSSKSRGKDNLLCLPTNHIGTHSFCYPDTRFYPSKHWETNRLCEIIIIFMKLSQVSTDFPFFYAVSRIRLRKRLALCQLAELQSWKCTLHFSTESVYKASLFLHGNRTLSCCGFG